MKPPSLGRVISRVPCPLGGLFACEQLMYAGKLKAFNSLSSWYSECRMYRRDQDGRVVKERDHLMDAMRYLIMSGRDLMRRQPSTAPKEPRWVDLGMGQKDCNWMM